MCRFLFDRIYLSWTQSELLWRLVISHLFGENCRALHSIDVRERFDFFDVREAALGVILEYCLNGLKAAAPLVEPNTAADSAAAPACPHTQGLTPYIKVMDMNLFMYFSRAESKAMIHHLKIL